MRAPLNICSKLEKESFISGPLFVIINSLIRLSCHDPRILKTFKALAISPFISTYWSNNIVSVIVEI